MGPMDIVQLITDIDAFVWGPPMIVLLLGSHLFLTVPHAASSSASCPRPSSCR